MTHRLNTEREPSREDNEASRRLVVGDAVRRWVSQLVDLTGRNRLLFYRTLKRGTLELTHGNRVAVESALSGRKTRISRLLPSTAEEPERLEESIKTARTVYRKARELFEERGIETLFVAVGIVSWTTDTSSATPAAPLLMAPITLEPVGSGEVDYSLDIAGEWRVNDTLLLYLRQALGVDIDPELILANLELTGDWRSDAFDIFLKQAAAVPDVSVTDRTVVGTFQYTKLPMVRDIEDHVDALAANDLIAAIAGDEGAKATLRSSRVDVDPTLPNTIPPSDEFLVLDADSSQNYSINAAIAGESVVVQGPPGTGKSQTIANLIAALTARHKTVLFVAEKRAAIDAVVKRLDHVGLSDMVLDLHGGITSRKDLAQALSTSLHAVKTTSEPDNGDLDFVLTKTRSALVDHADALHKEREPFSLSLLQAYVRLASLDDDARTKIRFSKDHLLGLDAATAREARSNLAEWADLTAPIRSGATAWGETRIESQDAAHAALEAATDVATIAARTAADLDKVLNETGLSAPSTLSQWNELFTTLDHIDHVASRSNEEILDLDVNELEFLASELRPGHRNTFGRAWARMFSARYRASYGLVAEYWADSDKPNGRKLVTLAEHALAARTGWTEMSGDGRPLLPGDLHQREEKLKDLLDRLQALGAYFVTDLLATPHRAVPGWTENLVRDQAILFRLPRIAELETWFAAHYLEPLTDEVESGSLTGSTIGAAFDYAWLQSFIMTTTAGDLTLARFDGNLLTRRVHEYIEADRSHIDQTPHRIRRSIAERAVEARNDHPDQDELIRAQAKRKRGHLPLRDLFSKSPDVLTSLRPCWTMSPLLVAQVLPADQVFDVAIFDEASQIRPADAVSTILRAKQVIVAGDDRQLPPTTFFDSSDDEPDNEDGADSLVDGFESILDVLSALLRNRTLTWHYRSEDERLIAFSNHKYYGGGLTTFPGAAVDDPVNHALVPHRPGVTVDTRSSDDEVAMVVDLMLEHARDRSDETLGVIAMGSYHANRVDAALRERLEQLRDPTLDRFFSDNQQERAFVKNLERVQGDERDAIILTIGYTKQADGRLLNYFGPINIKGGERRLNVAVTRARKRITVVSGFSHTDMDPTKLNAVGAKHLYEYIRYAESGGHELSTIQDVPLNPFELSIQHRLEDAGLTVVPQYGVSGYRIDFAIVHPDKPGEFVLAVEADGASYHSTPTARDRDRLRQQMLERLGWHFYRIWSTDWFRDPNAEVQAILAEVQKGIDGGPRRTARDVSSLKNPGNHTQAAVRSRRPAVTPGWKIDEYMDDELTAMVEWIRSDTLLRTDDELLEEVMYELGFRRRGTRIVAAIEAAIERDKRASS